MDLNHPCHVQDEEEEKPFLIFAWSHFWMSQTVVCVWFGLTSGPGYIHTPMNVLWSLFWSCLPLLLLFVHSYWLHNCISWWDAYCMWSQLYVYFIIWVVVVSSSGSDLIVYVMVMVMVVVLALSCRKNRKEVERRKKLEKWKKLDTEPVGWNQESKGMQRSWNKRRPFPILPRKSL